MISNFKLISSFKPQALKINLNLLENGIRVPPKTEEFDKFSIQGTLSLVSLNSIQLKRIVIQLLGVLDCVGSEDISFKDQVINSRVEVLSQETIINQGTSNFGFELVLPRTLASSVNSDFFKLSYTLSAVVAYENEQLVHQIPVEVYNNQLIPHLSAYSDSFQYSGTISNSVNYRIEFCKRLFNTQESINFRVNLDTEDNATVSALSASIVQKGAIVKRLEEASEGKISQEITLAKANNRISNTYVKSQAQFSIPLKTSSIKKTLIPSISSSNLEVKHIVQILINYQIQGQNSQTRFIQIPITISSNLGQLANDELPVYNQIELNSTHIPVAELPPVYSK
ncbi:hypothetical protein CONCODRAFT_170557 [Conidiobolus coronatus NRRL 28638]|uniref:Arrestin C-terminal-like domain-containing protein n=1 Tax=Conidiobolus coronatus (strain ATCC 28846 / CBS 209.66 / NRRL 28638) TaxID=796925 RepID=A0A137PH47_CONC2|nr:hypothetical protein CONCODRAFT_170557 [Conidiobolus coronatus NRRL 28638]|eukprot:KXN74329.1 hypothetical protein CONCODRAFT_170557 [Conidiobolus coronatus NRRL 28638]